MRERKGRGEVRTKSSGVGPEEKKGGKIYVALFFNDLDAPPPPPANGP